MGIGLTFFFFKLPKNDGKIIEESLRTATGLKGGR